MGAPLWGQSVCGTPLLEIPLLGHLCVGTPLCVGKPLYVGTYLCVGHLRVGAPLCAGHLCVGDTFCVAGTFVCEAPLCGGTFVWGAPLCGGTLGGGIFVSSTFVWVELCVGTCLRPHQKVYTLTFSNGKRAMKVVKS